MTEPSSTSPPLLTTRLNDLTVVKGFEEFLRANNIDSLEALFSTSAGESLSKPGLASWRERIRLDLGDEGTSRTLYLKRFSRPPNREVRALGRFGRGASSMAGVEWMWMNRLARDGIACVRPIAFGEEHTGTREVRSALLTEKVEGKSLEQWAIIWGAAEAPNVRALLEPTAFLVARFHRLGYVHRDLYLSHIFYDPALEPGEALRLIDLQRVMRPASLKTLWVIKDLASLNFSTPSLLVSRVDRIRWLKLYLGVPKLDARAKQILYLVVGKTHRIARHERRRQSRVWFMD